MLRNLHKTIVFVFGLVLSVSALLSDAKPTLNRDYKLMLQQVPADSVTKDSTRTDTLVADSLLQDSIYQGPYKPSVRPAFNPNDRFGDPFSNRTSRTPFLLNDSDNLKLGVKLDTGKTLLIDENIGEVNYRPGTRMSYEQFEKIQEQRMLKNYWKDRSAGLDGESPVSSRGLIPPIYVSPMLDRIFGGSYVNITPSGFVTLDFSTRINRTYNPEVPVSQQRNVVPLQFDQQISMNVVGKVGEKLQVNANFDNNSTFDFQNNMKVEYTGFEEEIIKKIEVGNVSLPVSNSLISGGQNLFGVKTQLQFGKLFVTGIASTQRGKTETMEIEGGAQSRQFEMMASDYDENRHFFLGHFFRENYEKWLSRLPQVISGINVPRIEVYVLNRSNKTQNLRNIVGLMDLGEARNIHNTQVVSANNPSAPTDNKANSLFNEVTGLPNAFQDAQVSANLDQLGLEKGTDYVRVNNARRLDETEFTINAQLGYISLNRKLQPDEVLAVSYEYTYNGERHQVGELSADYAGRSESEVIFLKLLRPAKINPEVPTWDLMMKNIYSLNASQINQEGFELRVIYKDDKTGQDLPQLQEGAQIRNKPLVEVMGLDRLNTTNDRGKDGNFDFIDGLTINTEKGHVIFPVLEPFGTHLEKQFTASEQELSSKYVFDELYNTTKNDAEQVTAKNKFFLKGKVQGGSSSEFRLDAFNIAEGSVVVKAGNTVLQDKVHYTVDYQMSKVRIIDQGILNSGQKITISYEKGDMFNFRTRTLVGSRFDYRFNEDINLGGTVLHLSEVPLNSRPNVGDEPNSNTKWGLDFNMRKDSRFITKMVDFLPFLETKEKSTVTLSTEVAQLKPGTSNNVDGDGASYIDDFEQTAIPYSLGRPNDWSHAATPETDDYRFDPSAGQANDLKAGYKRAKLTWYTVDDMFYNNPFTSGPGRPDNITEEDMKNHYVRQIPTKEIFPYKQVDIQNNIERTFDLAYFPEERGIYNYNPQLKADGTLPQPQDNWAGVTREITSNTDFDQNNIEYIEFWVMDPFLDGERAKIAGQPNNNTGGKLVFNLGKVSEDVARDSRVAFENGLPEDGSDQGVVTNTWGKVTTDQNLTRAFATSEEARSNQDVGIDGLKNEEEVPFFQQAYLNMLQVNGEARTKIFNDPSGDDFLYFLDAQHDDRDHKVIERYKDFRGMDGNSPVANTNIPQSNSSIPNNEDLNEDNILNEVEEYYEYSVDLRPGNMEVGENHIVDKVTANVEGDEVNWYLVRIPVRNPEGKFGNINGFKNIQFIRTYLTGFKEPVVLRMAKFQFVGSQWRRYKKNLRDPEFAEYPEAGNTNVDISVVNIEENAQGGENKSGYVLPPGIQQDIDINSPQRRKLNEQSVQLCVDNLEDKDARAIFKNVNLDLVNYGRLKMFLHAESQDSRDGELNAFLRLGTDFTDNYYEIEVPLTMTQPGENSREAVWPQENEIDLALNDLYVVKSKRNQDQGLDNITTPYTAKVGRYNITVVGNPDLSAVQTMMIGMRNPESDDRSPRSGCIWANELRVTDFQSDPGYAANARMNVKLADLGNVSAAGRYTSFGFGGIQDRIQERSRDEIKAYDVSANMNLDKFLPEESGIKLPMYVSYQNQTAKPKFDPRDPDTPLDASLQAIEDPEKREEYEDMAIAQETRRSINFTNVRKERKDPNAEKHLYDIENFSLTYAYSDVNRSNIDTDSYESKRHQAALTYDYSPKPLSIEPFKNLKAFNSPYLKLIKDFNFSPVPSNISFRTDMNRMFTRTQLRNQDLTTQGIDPTWEKQFNINRQYNLRWNLTKNLSVDFNARTNGQIDEPEGDINTREKRNEVLENLKTLGRKKNYDQRLDVNYKLPLDKLPMTDWMSANANYSAGYTWTAGALDQQQDTLLMGNTIQNNREMGVTGKLNFEKLYNKVDYLKKINRESRRKRRKKKDDEEGSDNKFLKGLLRGLMAVRSVNFNYNLSEGTMLNGFGQSPFLMGMDSSFNAPGMDFIFGSQDPSIRFKAAQRGWLVKNEFLTQPFTQNRSVNLNLRATIEPIKDLRIQLDAKKSKSANFQEVFRYDTASQDYQSLTPSRTGNYSVSFLSIGTAFGDMDENLNSKAFKNFEAYRNVIRNRIGRSGYTNNSQDVMIPAFIAAYSGKDPNEQDLSPFPKMPLPNWRMDYSGLGKIPALKEIFSSVSLTHAYSSSYNVTNYNSSLQYGDVDLSRSAEDYQLGQQTNDNGETVPTYQIGQVAITERFSPLIGLNLRTRSRLTAKIEYNKERNLALSMTNGQVTEQRNNDFVLDIGYTKSNFNLPFRFQGRTVSLKNDLTFRLGMTFRDTETIQHKLDDESTITNGRWNFIMKPSITYVMNKRLNLQVYFERNINEPKISTSFKTANTTVGAQLRFSLSQ